MDSLVGSRKGFQEGKVSIWLLNYLLSIDAVCLKELGMAVSPGNVST